MGELLLESKLISKALYDKEAQELGLTYKTNNQTWKYFNVTEEEIVNMLSASSAGSYFLVHIKPNKKAVQI